MKKPTIEELEKTLNSTDKTININPDGSITTQKVKKGKCKICTIDEILTKNENIGGNY